MIAVGFVLTLMTVLAFVNPLEWNCRGWRCGKEGKRGLLEKGQDKRGQRLISNERGERGEGLVSKERGQDPGKLWNNCGPCPPQTLGGLTCNYLDLTRFGLSEGSFLGKGFHYQPAKCFCDPCGKAKGNCLYSKGTPIQDGCEPCLEWTVTYICNNGTWTTNKTT